MKNPLKAALILFLSVFASICFSAETAFSKQLEQQVISDWIVSYTKGATKKQDANFIVKLVYDESEKTKIDPLLIIALISKESTFKKYATSGYGAKGLMQVVPRWHMDKLKKRDPYNRIVAIEVGSKVLLDCLAKRNYNTHKALTCYSGGAKNYQSFIQAKHQMLASEIVKARFANELPIEERYSYKNPILKNKGFGNSAGTQYAGI
jgi:soluble lytic murein transglycosylase-like protein